MNGLPKFFAFSFSLLLMCFSTAHAAGIPGYVDGEKVPSLAPMLKQTTPAVVNISTSASVKLRNNPLLNDPFFRHFFNLPNQQQPKQKKRQSLGSGVIVNSSKGYVITNYHVIKAAEEIKITLHDGRSFNAELIGSDPESDIAVVQIKADNLTAIPLADSEELEVGDFVVAIGNPFGLGQTVTSGIVSALSRSGLGIEGYEDFIQTDASINPGNSGGALVNLKGELVGINTAILAPSGGNVGIGFAIPSNMVKSLILQIIEFGEVRRGVLGVSIQDVTPELASAFNAEMLKGGALITEVTPGSSADRAGIKNGDIVLAVNGKGVDSAADLRNSVGLLRAGSKVKLELYRNGGRLNVTAVITPPEDLIIKGDGLHPNLAGAVFGSSEKHLRDKARTGVVILKVAQGSPAWYTGLRKGDVILSANKLRVKNVNEFEEAATKSQRRLLLNIHRGNEAFFLVIK